MQVVYAPGCWDLLHVGHVSFLERARDLGGTLIVGVPSDDVVEQDKRIRPIIPLQQRLKMVASLHVVRIVVPYHRLEFLPELKLFQPSILAVGEDWGTETRHVEAEQWMEQHGGRTVRIPRSPGVSTSQIIETVRKEYCREL